MQVAGSVKQPQELFIVSCVSMVRSSKAVCTIAACMQASSVKRVRCVGKDHSSRPEQSLSDYTRFIVAERCSVHSECKLLKTMNVSVCCS